VLHTLRAVKGRTSLKLVYSRPTHESRGRTTQRESSHLELK